MYIDGHTEKQVSLKDGIVSLCHRTQQKHGDPPE